MQHCLNGRFLCFFIVVVEQCGLHCLFNTITSLLVIFIDICYLLFVVFLNCEWHDHWFILLHDEYFNISTSPCPTLLVKFFPFFWSNYGLNYNLIDGRYYSRTYLLIVPSIVWLYWNVDCCRLLPIWVNITLIVMRYHFDGIYTVVFLFMLSIGLIADRLVRLNLQLTGSGIAVADLVWSYG